MKQETFNEQGEKYCFRCKKYHPTESFYKNKTTASGYSSSCKLGMKPISVYEISLENNRNWKNQFSEIYPGSKLGSVYKYERPDAYDLYINSKRLNP